MLSLDDLPQTSLGRADSQYQFVALSVSRPGADGHHTIYALAVDPTTSTFAALPALIAVSVDDGAHWSVRELRPDDVAGDYPRCDYAFADKSASLQAGPDSKTAYLFCQIDSVGEAALEQSGVMCTTAYYVTHDAGVTWKTVAARFEDPSAVSPQNPRPCAGPNAFSRPNTAGVVWDRRSDGVYRSTDDGRTFQPSIATDRAWSSFSMDVTARSGSPVVLVWAPAGDGFNPTLIQVATNGRLQQLPPCRCRMTLMAPAA